MSEQSSIARPVPRFPPSQGSLAAAYQAYQRSPRARWHRFLAKIEPWYNWGKTATIWRLDSVERDFSDESTGEAYELELQWLGLHLGIVVGRTPPKIGASEVAANKRRLARQETAA